MKQRISVINWNYFTKICRKFNPSLLHKGRLLFYDYARLFMIIAQISQKKIMTLNMKGLPYSLYTPNLASFICHQIIATFIRGKTVYQEMEMI